MKKLLLVLFALCTLVFAQKLPKTFDTEDQSWFIQDLGNFTWDKAMEACPSDWRLPANEDWQKLNDFLAANPNIQNEFRKNAKIKEKAASGIKASSGYWWSATESDNSKLANFQFLYDGYSDFYEGDAPKSDKLAVRCVK
ncbi:MAG: hypothetical protein FWB90_02530 [Fibromonadales bacterium]|nr:hypothetical protein [Fibromonadales bacterium]